MSSPSLSLVPVLVPVLVLVLVLRQSHSSVRPRVSFSLGSPGRPLVSFGPPDLHNGTVLLLSPDQNTLFVGAQDAVFVLDVGQKDAIRLVRKLEWSPTEKDIEQCSMKGKKVADCGNFIRVLEFLNSSHIYSCGTFAFSPRCVYIDVHTLSLSERTDEGRGRCPYDPYQPNTALTVDGELYTGTVADYRGNRPVISRHLSEGGRGDLKLDDTLGWLEDPTFVRSLFVPAEEKIYFFFSEVGREYDFVERLLVSRVAQICTSDVGGQRTLQRRWTTFAKAQLLCQDEGELPYNLIQDMDLLPPAEGANPEDTLFYGVFTSQWKVNRGLSAVCVFSLRDMRTVFSGSYRVLNRDSLQWSSRLQEKLASPGECGLHNASDTALRFVKENFLTEESVRPTTRKLTLVSQHNYRHISVQRVRAASGRRHTLLYLLSDSGLLHKVVLLPSGTHVIEEVQVFQRAQPISSMKLSSSQGVLFVGSSEGVHRLSVSSCSFYRSCAQCVLSRDPHCGWDSVRRRCAEVEAGTTLAQDVERAQVDEACAGAPTAACPPGVLVSVSLNEVVRLHCPAPSLLSRRQWERPNSRLSEQLYLTLEDGSLSFVATPATLGHYLCVCTEGGFHQTTAVYQVRQNSSPPAPEPPTAQPTEPITEQRTDPHILLMGPRGPPPRLTPPILTPPSLAPPSLTPPRLPELQREGPCYLKELLVVTGLLVLCLSLLLTLLMYMIRLHCHHRTAPGPPSPPQHRGGPKPPHSNSPPQHRGGPKPPHSNSSVSTPSNGHLPNVPL